MTVVGLNFGGILGGAVVTETLFNWPGIGRLLIDSVSYRDYPMIQALVLLAVLCVMGVNVLADLVIAGAEPAHPVRLMRWLWRRRSLAIGALLVGVVLVAAAFAPLIAPLPPDAQDLANSLMPPDAGHLFGTDAYGRDLFARVLFGARISLLEILLGVGIAAGGRRAAGVAVRHAGGDGWTRP